MLVSTRRLTNSAPLYSSRTPQIVVANRPLGSVAKLVFVAAAFAMTSSMVHGVERDVSDVAGELTVRKCRADETLYTALRISKLEDGLRVD